MKTSFTARCVYRILPRSCPGPGEAFRYQLSGFCPEWLIVLRLAVHHDECTVISVKALR